MYGGLGRAQYHKPVVKEVDINELREDAWKEKMSMMPESECTEENEIKKYYRSRL